MTKFFYAFLTISLISSCKVNRSIDVKLFPISTDAKDLGIVQYLNLSEDSLDASEKQIARKLGASYFKAVSFQHIKPKMENDTFDSKTTFLIGMNQDSIMIIPDANNNNSFYDDNVIKVNKEILQSRSLKNITRLPFVHIQNLQALYQDKKYSFTRKIYLLPDTITNGQLRLILISNEQVQGTFKYNRKQHFVNVRLNSPYTIFADSMSQINIKISDSNFSFTTEYREEKVMHLRDTAIRERNVFTVPSVSVDLSSLKLQFLPRNSISTLSSDTILRHKNVASKIDYTGQPYQHLKILTDLTGFSQNGKIVFLNFWFAECPPCIAEFSSLNSLYKKFKGDSTFKMVSVTFETPEVVEKFREKYSLNFDIYTSSSDTVNLLNLTPLFPTNIIIDRNGIINKYFIGGETNSKLAEEYFEKIIIPYIEKLKSK